ncbi:glycosyltransferase [Candidatus Pacearchaeota archaeon]|nr:glycosyltransferase [Candidatus Pacearchaeota archaeon]
MDTIKTKETKLPENCFISIIIPCYNTEKSIKSCLDCALESSFKNFEVICVDDCSTDDTVKIINSYDNVRLVKLAKNSGAAVTRNEGAKIAKGDILLFFDSDILIRKDTLENISDDIANKKGDVIVAIYSKEHPFKNIASNYKNLHMRYVYYIMPDYISILNTSCVAIKKEAFEAVNGFDSNIKILSGEDWEIGKRIVSKGYRIYMDKEIEVIHKKYLTLIDLVKMDLRKMFGLVKLLARSGLFKNKVYNTGRTERIPSYTFYMAASGFIVLGITFLIPTIILTKHILPSLTLFAFIILYLLVNKPFFSFLLKARGLSFFLVSTLVYFLNIWVLIIGSLAGFFDYFILHNRY